MKGMTSHGSIYHEFHLSSSEIDEEVLNLQFNLSPDRMEKDLIIAAVEQAAATIAILRKGRTR